MHFNKECVKTTKRIGFLFCHTAGDESHDQDGERNFENKVAEMYRWHSIASPQNKDITEIDDTIKNFKQIGG